MIAAPARFVPDDVAVEIARDHRRPLAEEAPVARHGAAQRPELMLARRAGAGVLRPHRQEIAGGRAFDMHGRDVAQRRMVGLGKPRSVAVEGKHAEALVWIASNPHRLTLYPGRSRPLAQALRFGAFTDDGDVGCQVQKGVDLAIERHVAVPGDDSHGSAVYSPCPSRVPARRDRRKNHWKTWKPMTR